MKSFLFVISQLALVTIVYVLAYRAGFRAANSKAMSVVREFAKPAECLLDQLKDSIDEAVEGENDHPELDIRDSNDEIAARPANCGSTKNTDDDQNFQ